MSAHTRLLKATTRAALIASVCVVLASAHDAHAQSTSSQVGRDRETRRTDLLMRQRALRDLDRVKNRPPEKAPDTRPVHKETAEDFKQLQIVNYSLAEVADPRVVLDYARVRKESAEVRRHAARLKESLSLPEVEADEKQEKAEEIQTPEALRAAVRQLDALVNNFVWNPTFQQPDVVDLEQSTKASRDLAGIIGLSQQIRKGAEELGKGLAEK